MSEYLDEFVQESEESITELNNALLDLERNPDDEAAMDRVFRTAHTLKGNCGAMGFDAASDLAHAVEDLLDAVRAGSLSITPGLMDEVFAAVDDLERMVGEVDRHGDVKTDPDARIADLRARLEASTGLVPPTEGETETLLSGADRRPRSEHRAFHARLSIAEAGGAETVVAALSDAFDLLATAPSTPAAVAEAETLDAAFGSAVGEGAVAAALGPVDAVEDAVITEVAPDVLDRALGADEPAGADAADPEEMAVDDLLEEFDEYDDLDEAVDRVDDVPGLEDMGEAGAFEDILEEDVEPAYAETEETATDADAGAPEPADADEPVADATSEFRELQREYDRVGLEEMAAELADVEFGEFDEEVGFEELLGEDAPSGAASEPTAVEPPDDEAIATLVDAARPPATLERGVHHVRLAVPSGDADAGEAVVAALRDAFDLLGTDPSETAVVAGEHDGTVDALFGSDLPTEEVRAALVGVEAVADVHLTDVTDRMPEVEPADEPETEASVDAGGETEDTMAEFRELQREYDQVGLEEMAAELSDVEFGEFDEEVGFEELLEDAPAEPESATDDEASVAEPTEAAVEAALEAASGPPPADREAYHLVLGVQTEPDRNNATRVVEALRDAFDLLGTRPETSTVAAEDPERLEAVLGSHVPESEIRAALEDVEEVGAVHVTEVTDRLRAASPRADADDEAAEQPSTDAMTAFRELQAEYDAVAPEEIEAEIEDTGIPGVDTDEEVGFEELLEPASASVSEASDADVGSEADAAPTEPDADAAVGDDVEASAGAEADPEPETTAVDEPETEAPAGAEPESETTADSEAAAGEAQSVEDVDVEEIDVEAIDLEEAEIEGGLEDVAVGSEFGVDVDVEAGPVAEETPAEEADAETEAPAPPEPATADVATIRGIGSSYSQRLSEAGVETVGELVAADDEALAVATDLSASRIEEWTARAPVDPSDLPADAAPEGLAAPADAEAAETGGDVDAAETESESDTEPETDASATESETPQSIRVDVDQVDELLNLVEGLVTSRARMRRALREAEVDVPGLEQELDELDVIGAEMQDVVMDMRLVPVRTVTGRLPRVVRDIAREQDKRVRFEVEGEGVEVDRSILSRMNDPLIHLVRNAVDHGIESPERRREAGKDEEGRVTLRAYRARDTVYVEVEDDGRGLDPDALRAAAVERGVLSAEEAEALSAAAARELVFEPGFSTTEEVTDVSGRGVGMDVVASTVAELDGDVEIESTPGEGTTVRLALPVSVAISEVLFMEVGDEEYGVPIKVVDEIEGMGAAEPVTDGGEAVRTPSGDERELIDLGEAMDARGRETNRELGGPEGRGMLVTLEDDVRAAAIRCDRVRGQQEVVVKPFEGFMADIPGLSGAAILGEGDVVTIVDVETL